MLKKNKKIVIYLPIEVLIRELDAKMYLAVEFMKWGYTVILGSKGGVYYHLLHNNSPFIYIDKGIDPGNIKFYKNIIKRGGITIDIKEEAGIVKDLKLILLPYQEEVLLFIKTIFCWGILQKKRDSK